MRNLSAILPGARPAQDFVYIKKLPENEKSKGGILIPRNATTKDKAHEGHVVAIGPGRFDSKGNRRPMPDIRVGDHVVIDPYGEGETGTGTETEFAIVRASEIIAVIDPKSTTGGI